MRTGAMNHPGRPVLDEIALMAETKLEFVDLTLEPPMAATWGIDLPAACSASLGQHGNPKANLGDLFQTAAGMRLARALRDAQNRSPRKSKELAVTKLVICSIPWPPSTASSR